MKKQLDLFGSEPPSESGAARVDPNAAFVELAARLPPHVRLGTSSWTFPGWATLVYHRRYPSQKSFVQESLAEYARFPLFRTVGIDRSYYGPIPTGELAGMRAQLPDGFLAVMKVWDGITTLQFNGLPTPGPSVRARRALPSGPSGATTPAELANHPDRGDQRRTLNPRFLDPELFETAVGEPVRASGFADRLGAFVVEIPATPDRPDQELFLGKLARFLERVPGPFAIELRDRRLFTRKYVDVLRAHGASHCFNFWSRMPTLGEQLELVGSVASFPRVVIRLMLPPGERYEKRREAFAPFDRIVDAQPGMREDVARIVEATAGLQTPTFVIANNKAEGSAPRTLIALAVRLGIAPETE
jgi:uncharacterized protein YecE (DUF72 family)